MEGGGGIYISKTSLVNFQNIDTLESMAGLDPDKLVEAHGSFSKCHCLKCREYYSQDWMKGECMKTEAGLQMSIFSC